MRVGRCARAASRTLTIQECQTHLVKVKEQGPKEDVRVLQGGSELDLPSICWVVALLLGSLTGFYFKLKQSEVSPWPQVRPHFSTTPPSRLCASLTHAHTQLCPATHPDRGR